VNVDWSIEDFRKWFLFIAFIDGFSILMAQSRHHKFNGTINEIIYTSAEMELLLVFWALMEFKMS